MIELSPAAAPTPTVDLTRLRAVVPRYQRTQLARRLWGERAFEQVTVVAPSSSDASQGVTTLTDA